MIEFVTISLLFSFNILVFWPPPRDQTHTPCPGSGVLTTGLPVKSMYYILEPTYK